MIYTDQKLVDHIFEADAIERVPTRDGFGTGLVELGERDERIVVLCADLAESTRTHWFQEKFPERYIEIGVAEQNLATVASGLAAYGKIPFMTSYAAFNPGRNNEQIRTTISLNRVPVKVVGSHAGVSVGPDGATHQQLEDIALMRVQPNMQVVVPCDSEEARKATHAIAHTGEPAYLRLTREKTPLMTTHESSFEIGKAAVFWKGDDPDVAIIGCGPILHNAVLAAHELAAEGVSTLVLNNHSIKPMDVDAVIWAAREAGAVVTVEEHQILGGMGSAVAEVLAQNHPVPMELVGVHDRFGQSGSPEELIEHYGMGVSSIKQAVMRARERKA